MLNGTYSDSTKEATGKPCYKDANGNPIKIWMKLLRCTKRKDKWSNITNGDLSFDPFIREGVIELFKTNMPPTILKIDLSRESITPKDVNKTPTIGSGPIGGGVMTPTGTVVGSGDLGANAAFTDANSDMPF